MMFLPSGKNDAAPYGRNDVMRSANARSAHHEAKPRIIPEGRIMFRGRGTHHSPTVLKNSRRKGRHFLLTFSSVSAIIITTWTQTNCKKRRLRESGGRGQDLSKYSADGLAARGSRKTAAKTLAREQQIRPSRPLRPPFTAREKSLRRHTPKVFFRVAELRKVDFLCAES